MGTSQGLELFINPDNRTLKAKAPKRLSITTLDEWTNRFETYISIIVSCFPSRATELIACMGKIKEAAADFPGVGFLIYDYKFRMKAAADKSIYWGRTDSQLWLRIFPKYPSRLRETYQDVLDVIPNVNQSLFHQGPLYNGALHQGYVKTCNSYNRGKECYRNPCLFPHVCNRCYGGHPGVHCRAQPPECNKCRNVHSRSHCPTSWPNHLSPPPGETTQAGLPQS